MGSQSDCGEVPMEVGKMSRRASASRVSSPQIQEGEEAGLLFSCLLFGFVPTTISAKEAEALFEMPWFGVLSSMG